MNPILEIKNITKKFDITHLGRGETTFRESLLDVFKKGKSSKEEFLALDDVSFNVYPGDSIGIIGRNGAGKSTLLKILSKITPPTSGKVISRGRIASLLEVGTGFHSELTGRENIYLNGSILGLKRSEINRQFDAIVDFSGVEHFLDTPIKHYSSGMQLRLAFAVAAHLEPEVLIIDEVLAVGDSEFQKKCMGKMEEVSRNNGRTILFVSHNLNAMSNLCSKGIVLEKGRMVTQGTIGEAIAVYNSSHSSLSSKWEGKDGLTDIFIYETCVEQNSDHGFLNTKPITVKVIFEILSGTHDLVLGFNLLSNSGTYLARANFNDYTQQPALKAGKYELSFVLPANTLASGQYHIEFDIAIPFVRKINSKKIDLDFEVTPDGEIGNKYFIQDFYAYNSIIRSDWFNDLKVLPSGHTS